MSAVEFVANKQGVIDMGNEGFMQGACLSVAQGIAASAGARCGRAISADVRPGKTMCHARAQISTASLQREWRGIEQVAHALSDAAVQSGGRSNFKGFTKSKEAR